MRRSPAIGDLEVRPHEPFGRQSDRPTCEPPPSRSDRLSERCPGKIAARVEPKAAASACLLLDALG